MATTTNQPRIETRGCDTATALARADERRNLARDLHDGVQNELLSLILRLNLAEQDRRTPTEVAATFAALEEHALAALASLREIAHGLYPLPLIKLGVADALLAQAARAPIKTTVAGSTPRSTDEAEAAIYFCCSEAIQNAAKHGGHAAQVKLTLRHDHGLLTARIEDNGQGFDPAKTTDGAGLTNIRERVQTLHGTLTLDSTPGHGTILTISLPWPSRFP
jgi:signal transduction histidine kinase